MRRASNIFFCSSGTTRAPSSWATSPSPSSGTAASPPPSAPSSSTSSTPFPPTIPPPFPLRLLLVVDYRQVLLLRPPSVTSLVVSYLLLRPNYPLGKSLKNYHLHALAGKPASRSPGSIVVVLTSDHVLVEGFCSRCGSHWSSGPQGGPAFIWVGNSATQCPGQCAWPFHQPIYGSQVPPLVAPNGDVGIDGMIINLATLLARTTTNPFGNGVLPGAGDGLREGVRERGVSELPGEGAGGLDDGRRVQRKRGEREEVPAAGDVGPPGLLRGGRGAGEVGAGF
ncbi:hypothetical protein MLD38_009610 [Melastoma candidum]|uniref:Uncharacterized protein n=1 Tax=Melastoma candidum TaxID=119954 RepID=A0ACB9S6L5_9MYRT|nr:hypothetical protein MLD38_009610 [Melastoma candidum]